MTRTAARPLAWTVALVTGAALALCAMELVGDRAPFGAMRVAAFAALAAVATLVVRASAGRLLLPRWRHWSAGRRTATGAWGVAVIAIVLMLTGRPMPLGADWRWADGPQVSAPVESKAVFSWSEPNPAVSEINVSSWPESPDPEWASRMTTDLPARVGPIHSRVVFRVTQPDLQIFNFRVGAQWIQFRGADGVTVRFEANRGGVWRRRGEIAFNLHARAEERRWHEVSIDVPSSSRALAVTVDAGANHLGDTVWLSVDRVLVDIGGMWVDLVLLIGTARAIAIGFVAIMAAAFLDAVAGVSGAGRRSILWSAVAIPTLVVAWVVSAQAALLLGWQKSMWVGVTVSVDRPGPPPFLFVNSSGRPGESQFESVVWPPAARSASSMQPGARYQGWLLLPDREIPDIQILLGKSDVPYVVHEVAVYDTPPQVWRGPALASAAPSGPPCRQPGSGTGTLAVNAKLESACTVVLPDFRPLNVVSMPARLALFGGCAIAVAFGLAVLGAAATIRRAARRWRVEYGGVGRWLQASTSRWTLGRVVLLVTMTTLLFQAAYFLRVPFGYINDTHGYYGLARRFAHFPTLFVIDPTRTPGYPIFVALMIRLFGDQFSAIVAAQHLLLVLLGSLTAWFLYPRTGPLFAALGGLCVGVGPTMSLLANTVATESLYASVSYLALIWMAQFEERPAALVVAGVLGGLATLIRPNGVLLPAAMLAWMALRWWCSDNTAARGRSTLVAASAVCVGYLLIVSPWLAAEHAMSGRWELDRQSSFTLWFGSLIQGRSPGALAINRPAAAVFDRSTLASRCSDVEGWRLHTELVEAGLIDWPVRSTTADQRFFAESVREGIRSHPSRFFEFFRPTFAYSLFHRLPSSGSSLCVTDGPSSEVHYNRFTYAQPPPPPVTDANDMAHLLPQLAYRWQPAQSRLRSAVLDVTQAGIDGWAIVALLALGSVVICLAANQLRGLTMVWMYWLAAVTLLGIVGWPTDRYMFVLEPVVYLLAVCALWGLFSLRIRRAPAGR